MNLRIKASLTACLLFGLLLFSTGCSAEKTPYEINDEDQYMVSVKFDANGGTFTTNTSVIVDSYNLSGMKTNEAGMAEIALLPPDNAVRGNDAFTAINNGYFLAGWYAERTEITDSQGNPAFVYAGKWDFEKDLLSVDPKGSYSSSEPVLTLYAAWVPMFHIEFYSLDSGEYLDTYTFNPTTEGEILLPAWDAESGTIEMYDFPKKSGCTFLGAYYDENGTEPVETVAVVHPGTVDYETGTANNAGLKLYLDWQEGEWYHIYSAEQLLENASVSGCYVIHEDLDFTGLIWPTSLMYGNFSGTIQGNGHTFSNIELIQTNNAKVNAGLFGRLTETARLENLTFDNVTFTIQAGTRVVGTSYGLLAGSISAGASLTDVRILGSTLQIDSGSYFGVDDYSIGLLCGMGDPSLVADPEIACIAVGDNPERLEITVSGNEVTLHVADE